jgi:hypothetical protein
MRSENLVLKVNRFENGFTIQITEQSEKVNNFMRAVGSYITHNGWIIKSDKSPSIDLYTRTISLRGSNTGRNLFPIRVHLLPSNYSRDSVLDSIELALGEFNSFLSSLPS